MSQNSTQTTQNQMILNAQQPIIPLQIQSPLINQSQVLNGSALLIDSIASVNAVDSTAVSSTIVSNILPAPPTPPGAHNRAISTSEKAHSIESPGSTSSTTAIEWAIKGPIKLKYTQLFNTTDRTRSGYLTGAQARNLLIQSKLQQGTLAQIWALADMDSDGRLSCDEFVLAMYLCEMASQGEPIPVKLPTDMIPPSFRKTSTSRQGSVSSRHGSISSQSGSAQLNISDTDLHNYNQTTFEDKRKENFDKGQAELERRRKILQGTKVYHIFIII